ncbi:MAG: PAS domain S-box protein [Acidobacteria bacterium]|nr:PAS domain S-box protein [Acidobacteriota bacterium]
MSLNERELEELRAAEARSRTVMETVADAVVTVDEAGTILFVNRAAERVFGRAAEEMLGAPLTMLMPDYMRRVHEAGMRRYVGDRRPAHLVGGRRAAGSSQVGARGAARNLLRRVRARRAPTLHRRRA